MLKSRTGVGKPATAEARQVGDMVARAGTALSGRTLSPDAREAWQEIERTMLKIDQAYRLRRTNT